MNRKELRNKLLNDLAVELKPEGYILIKKQAKFVRQTDNGWWALQIIFLTKEIGWELNLGMLIRINLVEDLYHKSSYYATKYHNSTPTIGISVENFMSDGQEYRMLLNYEADINYCCKQIIYLLKNIAIPFFLNMIQLRD